MGFSEKEVLEEEMKEPKIISIRKAMIIPSGFAK